jgi:outer membrane protein OmpA-like peptidoglycan-associated protein
VLDEVAELLRKTPSLHIQLDGFCDDPCPSFQESLTLGEARANAVADFLREAGIAADRFIVSSSGNSHQVVPGDSEEGRAFNRRVELRPTY